MRPAASVVIDNSIPPLSNSSDYCQISISGNAPAASHVPPSIRNYRTFPATRKVSGNHSQVFNLPLNTLTTFCRPWQIFIESCMNSKILGESRGKRQIRVLFMRVGGDSAVILYLYYRHLDGCGRRCWSASIPDVLIFEGHGFFGETLGCVNVSPTFDRVAHGFECEAIELN